MDIPERFEQEPRPSDPEWVISELRTLSARWSEVDTKRPLSAIDLDVSTPPRELAAPNEQELRQREWAVANSLLGMVERGMFNDEQKERLREALNEAMNHFDSDDVVAILLQARQALA
jgi:hypothetical protein